MHGPARWASRHDGAGSVRPAAIHLSRSTGPLAGPTADPRGPSGGPARRKRSARTGRLRRRAATIATVLRHRETSVPVGRRIVGGTATARGVMRGGLECRYGLDPDRCSGRRAPSVSLGPPSDRDPHRCVSQLQLWPITTRLPGSAKLRAATWQGRLDRAARSSRRWGRNVGVLGDAAARFYS